jgi:uncharacterized phage-associated protein
MLSAKDIANYFLSKSYAEPGESISNLKIQKLVYYAQGFYLALYGKPLFDDNIEAWIHGPVVPELYYQYKKFGSCAIPIIENMDLEKYPKEVIDLLDEIYNVYGQFSAWKLRELTHSESPWINTPKIKGSVISHEELKKYFITQIENETEN